MSSTVDRLFPSKFMVSLIPWICLLLGFGAETSRRQLGWDEVVRAGMSWCSWWVYGMGKRDLNCDVVTLASHGVPSAMLSCIQGPPTDARRMPALSSWLSQSPESWATYFSSLSITLGYVVIATEDSGDICSWYCVRSLNEFASFSVSRH